MAIEALISDIGNVIFPERWDLVLEKIQILKRSITLEQFMDAYSKEWEKYRVGGISSEKYWKNVAVELGLDESLHMELSNDFTSIWHEPDGQLCSFLQGLNGKFRIYALSNSCLENEAVIRDGIKNGRLSFINRFYLSHREQIAKPDEAAYRNVLNSNQLAAENCIYLDDKERNIIPARRIGMHGIIYSDFEKFKDEFYKITKQ